MSDLVIGDRDQLWIDTMQERLSGECKGMRKRHRADTLFLLVMGGRILTMQTGFAMLESAYGEKMNAANIMMKNTMDMLAGALAFFFIGYWLAFDEAAQWDVENNFDYAMWFAQFSYATTAATIDSGALAGRVAYSSYVIFSICVTGVIYPLCVRMTWGGGWLDELGFIDFAGSAIVHMVGATSACVSALLLGPRIGRFPMYRTRSKLWRLLALDSKGDAWYRLPEDSVERAIFVKPRGITNPVQALFGLFVLIVGFLAFNPASTLATTGDTDLLGARATVTTLLAASGGAFACVAWALAKRRVPNITIPDFVTGVLASLVGSCACCHVITPLVAIAIGFVAAAVAFVSQELVDYMQIDDVVGAIAVHGPPGVIGTLSVAIFAKPHCLSSVKGLVYGGGAAAWEQLGVQCVGVLALGAFAAGSTYVLVTLINLFWGFRCDRSAELIGLDYTEHSYDDGTYTGDQNKVAFLTHSPIKRYSIARLAPGSSKTGSDGGTMSRSTSVGSHSKETPAAGEAVAAAEGGRKEVSQRPDAAEKVESQKRASAGDGSAAAFASTCAEGEMQSLTEELADLKKMCWQMQQEMRVMKEHMSKPTQRMTAVQQLRQREELVQQVDPAPHYGAGLRTLQQLARDFSGATGTPSSPRGGGGGRAPVVQDPLGEGPAEFATA
mmetsp:Transcript_8431/g.18925  ORF Transcript_8431/g.18925 Transcript_8431/m.18925 type:complete len:668 (+) Transcript_8431:195-2198(+)